nr:PilZ domain-containing protein [Desulfobotulus pelophilus]
MRFLQIESAVRIRCTCRECRHTYRVLLERRRFIRKPTACAGRYRISGRTPREGDMIVVDISRTGLQIQSMVLHVFYPGERVELEFRLDKGSFPLIRREALVKNVRSQYVGMAFVSQEHTDALGPYLAFL